MSIWIKICGNTSLADAQLAAESGADAVGFVFAPSPRRVSIEQVAAITPHLPAATEKIGVFVGASFDEIAFTVEACSLTGVQLHFDPPPELTDQLRRRFGPQLRILRVIHFNSASAHEFASAAADPNTSAVLVDSRTATAAGGTGIAYDWIDASKSLFWNPEMRKQNLVVAGGLTPANVADPIAALEPWGVDVVSGVESAPGKKDPDKVRAFIANARLASR
jgi:phosphoribosylanthranilate isomerase